MENTSSVTDVDIEGPNSDSQLDVTIETNLEKRSVAHKHFELQGDKYFCKICRKSYARDKTGSTGGLIRHLKATHPHLLSSEKSDHVVLRQTQLTGRRVEIFTTEGFKKRLLNLILMKDLAFNLVDDQYLKDLLEYCNPSAVTPSARTLRRKIQEVYDEEKSKLRVVLKTTPGKISFVVDCWTSPNQTAFQGIMATYIDKDWNLQSILLDVTPLNGPHSGANLCQSFTQLLEDFGIKDKLLAMTMDNASNMATFCNKLRDYLSSQNIEFDPDDMRVRCLAHVLNLACKDAINSMLNVDASEIVQSSQGLDIDDDDDDENLHVNASNKTLIAKLRKGVVKIRSSPQRREAYFRQCKAAGLKTKIVIEDVRTRWNSTYLMMKRAIKMKLPYNATIYADSKLKMLALSDEEWANLDLMMEFLKPFKLLTAKMMEGQFPSISLCGLVYLELFQHVESYIPGKQGKASNDYPAWLQEAAKLAYAKLDKYYPTSDGAVYVIGSVLDPRLKLDWHKDNFPNDIVQKYRSMIKKRWESEYKMSSGDQSQALDLSRNEPDIFERHLTKRSRIEVRDELQVYLAEKPVHPSLLKGIGPLAWWKAHDTDFPNLSKMAKDYLAVAGTGVSIERFFSLGKLLLDDKRQSMNEETVQQCLSLKIWLKSQNNPDAKNEIYNAVLDKIQQ